MSKVGRPKKSKYNIEDYIGIKINEWKIVSFSHLNSHGEQYWNTKCSCGRLSKIRVYPLIKGLSKGCKHCRPQSGQGNFSPWWLGYSEFTINFFNKVRDCAKARNISFEITPEYLQEIYYNQDKKCAYTGVDIFFPTNSSSTTGNASVDRIDSSLGYIKGNVHLVLKEINIMKMALKHEKFIELCRMVANYTKEIC